MAVLPGCQQVHVEPANGAAPPQTSLHCSHIHCQLQQAQEPKGARGCPSRQSQRLQIGQVLCQPEYGQHAAGAGRCRTQHLAQVRLSPLLQRESCFDNSSSLS